MLCAVGPAADLWQWRWELQTDKVWPRRAAAAGGEVGVVGHQEEGRQ